MTTYTKKYRPEPRRSNLNIGKLIMTKRVEFAVFGTLTVDSVETSKGVLAVSMAQDPQVASQHLAARAAESERWELH